MKKQLLMLIGALSLIAAAHAQNVGIGTATPQAKLHVFNTDNTAVLAETNGASKYAGFEARTNAGANDNLFVRKWMPGSSGTMAGVSLNNLSQVVAGVGAGPLMIGVANNNPLYFTTNNIERMRVTSGGEILINNTDNFALLNMGGRTDKAVTIYVYDSVRSGGQRQAIAAGINTSYPASVAIGASTYENGGVSPLEPVTYAIVGTSGNAGYSVAAYSVGSTALRGRSNTGLALHTTGLLRLEGNGAGAGKVLTSLDASGNATWQSLSGSHNHFGETWTGDGIDGLTINNSSSADFTAAFTANATSTNSGNIRGIMGTTSSPTGVGILGANLNGGAVPYAPGSGVAGTSASGPGVYAASYTGYSLYAAKTAAPNFLGVVARFENQNVINTATVAQIAGYNPSQTLLDLLGSGNGQKLLNLNNGFLQVTGNSGNKTAFKHTTTGGNTAGNLTVLTYNGAAQSDIVIVTHCYSPTNVYLNKAVGVYWNNTTWTIYVEDATAMPLNTVFNVLVIKQ